MPVRKSALTLIAVAIVLSFGGCSKSSPTEPTFTASLDGTVAICGYEQGTLTVRDASGKSQSTTLTAGTGNFSFGTVFVAGPYDVYLDKAGKAQKTVAMHGQDSSSPQMKVGQNQFYWMSLGCN
jgi:hypothetical protein